MSAPAWQVPVRLEEVPAAGQRFALEADAATRAGLSAAGLAGMPRLTATFDVARHGRDGLHVAGTVWATVQQTCVVTLEPIESEVEEAIDLTFVPAAGRDHSGVAEEAEARRRSAAAKMISRRWSTAPSISARSPSSSCCSASTVSAQPAPNSPRPRRRARRPPVRAAGAQEGGG